MHATVRPLATLTFAVALATGCSQDTTAPTATPPKPNAPSFSINFTYPTIAAPTNLTAQAGSGGVHLTWTDNSNNETNFNVQFFDAATGVRVVTFNANANATSVDVQPPGGTYNVQVFAVGYYWSSDPAVPSTNLWSPPSNTVLVTAGGGGTTSSPKPCKGRKCS
jgi:hypothetical protein